MAHLSLDEVLAIHEALLARFGGSGGVRDKGLLESALFRPQTGYYQDLVETAAALFESLLMNHPFVDGNKRVAFFATDIFLRLNGWKSRWIRSRRTEYAPRPRKADLLPGDSGAGRAADAVPIL